MADEVRTRVTKLRVKQSTGDFGDEIPLGAKATNIDITATGTNLETEITNMIAVLQKYHS